MTRLQRILLIPSLLPLLVVLAISAMHRGKPTRLHLLAWSSPAVPLGVWTAIAATSAAGLTATAAIFVAPARQPLRRRVRQPDAAPTPFPSSAQEDGVRIESPVSFGPQRDLRDPAPTVAVAYRVIKRGSPRRQPNPSVARSTNGSVEEPIPSRVDTGSSPAATSEFVSDWGDDPNRDW